MKTAAPRKWHAMLLAVMRTRVTLLQNWRAKLISLLLAITVWYLIKKNVETTPSPSGKSLTERVTKTRWRATYKLDAATDEIRSDFSSPFLLKHGSPFLVIENGCEIPVPRERA
jgi:hypothetical protein